MPRKPRDYTLGSIDPTYRATWEKASLEAPLFIPLDNQHARTRLRQKMYECRKMMEAQQDELFGLIQFMSIYEHAETMPPGVDVPGLIIDTADKSIKAALATIGIGTMQAPDFEQEG